MERKIDDYYKKLQCLYAAYKNKDLDREKEYFDYVFKYLLANDREKDAFYLLFLHGYNFGFLKKYINYYIKKHDDIVNDYETACDGLRSDVYNICFDDVKKTLKRNELSFENEYERLIEMFLLEKGYERFYKVENKITQKANAEKYDSIFNYLNTLNSFGFLNCSQKNLLYLLKVYSDANLSGIVPAPTNENVPMIFPLLVQTNNFILAKKLLDEYYDKNPDIDRNSNPTYSVLSKIVSLLPIKDDSCENKCLIDDLIALVREGEISFDEAIKKLPLSDDDKNQAMLLMAKDCYYKGSIVDGDRYLNMVEKSSHKGSEIKKQASLIRSRKKFLQFDENKPFVFTK